MRFYTASILSTVLAALSTVMVHAQAYGADANKIANDANGPGSYRTAPPVFGASALNVMHRRRCALTPTQSKRAETLSDILVARARSAWNGADHQPPATREGEVEHALVRTLERINECPIIAHRAVSLARQVFSQTDPGNEAFDLALTAMDVVDQGQSCDCRAVSGGGPAFGGPPLGDSGGSGGGVTHPPVATPQ